MSVDESAVRTKALSEAAAICQNASFRLTSGKRRISQVDEHMADVLQSMARKIMALETAETDQEHSLSEKA